MKQLALNYVGILVIDWYIKENRNYGVYRLDLLYCETEDNESYQLKARLVYGATSKKTRSLAS